MQLTEAAFKDSNDVLPQASKQSSELRWNQAQANCHWRPSAAADRQFQSRWIRRWQLSFWSSRHAWHCLAPWVLLPMRDWLRDPHRCLSSVRVYFPGWVKHTKRNVTALILIWMYRRREWNFHFNVTERAIFHNHVKGSSPSEFKGKSNATPCCGFPTTPIGPYPCNGKAWLVPKLWTRDSFSVGIPFFKEKPMMKCWPVSKLMSVATKVNIPSTQHAPVHQPCFCQQGPVHLLLRLAIGQAPSSIGVQGRDEALSFLQPPPPHFASRTHW